MDGRAHACREDRALILAASALLLGFLHGLGADHLMAIAALSIRPGADSPSARRARALGIALRFAAGHALLLACGAGALVVLGWSVPLVFERAGERLGGILLVLLGGAGLWGVLASRRHGHAHDGTLETAPRGHLHLGRRERHAGAGRHSHLPAIIGAAFAVSGLRALTLLPLGIGAAPLPRLLGLIVVFAVGILLAMAIFGVVLAGVMSAPRVARLERAAGGAMAVSSIALGVFWIVSA
ncbi:MAG: hypothetical protein ABI603_11000 [Acidobacteriota bacterium]